MKKLFLTFAIVCTAAALASTAFAVPNNTRPVGIVGAGLQTYFDGVPQAIDVDLDQEVYALWGTTASNNSTLTLLLEASDIGGANAFGIYSDGNAGTLFEVFAGAAMEGWFAVASFSGGDLTVNLFDETNAFQGFNFYAGVASTDFGFYIENAGGTYYSEDDENTDLVAHNLVYAGTGLSAGQWWLTWEEDNGGGDLDYDDMIIFAESINPVPEPGTLMLLGFGLGGSALVLRLRRRRG